MCFECALWFDIETGLNLSHKYYFKLISDFSINAILCLKALGWVYGSEYFSKIIAHFLKLSKVVFTARCTRRITGTIFIYLWQISQFITHSKKISQLKTTENLLEGSISSETSAFEHYNPLSFSLYMSPNNRSFISF